MPDSLFDDLPPPPSNGPYARPLGHYRVPAEVPPNPTVPDEAKPRVSRQCRVILAELNQGRVPLKRMMEIACNYRARLSELRDAGHDVRCVEHDYKTGRTEYALFRDGVEVGANFIN